MVEPLKYEKAKKEFLYNTEEIALNTSVYFFDLALSQTLLSLAKQNLERCDTLFKIGLERYRIGSISESELLTLKLEKINAINNIGKAELNFKKSHTTLSAFMNINNQIIINLNIPEEPLSVFVNEDDAIRFARENNPTYLSQKENILMAKQNLDQVKKSRFSASVSGSIGFNQVANNIKDAYLKPLQQDIVNVGFNIPLVDWGVRKGKKVMAKKNLELAMMDASRTLESFEDEIANAAREYNLYLSQIETAKEARDIANLAFAKTKKLFLIGKIDVNTVNIAMGRLLEAESNYITSLKNYWCSYRNLRKLTLYDFVNKKTLTAMFEYP
jgi:outer membrane protein TolC